MLITWITNTLLIALTVALHYESLRVMASVLRRFKPGRHKHQARGVLILVVLTLILVHAVEIWIWGIAIWLQHLYVPDAAVEGVVTGGFFEYIYLSAVSYSTVGFGEIYPVGPIRFTAAFEALTGLVMITWSASFTFVVMGRYWEEMKD